MSAYRAKLELVEAYRVPVEATDDEMAFMIGHGSIAGWLMSFGMEWEMSASKGYYIDETSVPYPDRFAEPGDWIVRDSLGVFSIWSPEGFETKYELAP